jgi:hypothetical protein
MRIMKFSAVVGMSAILVGLLVFTSCGGKEKDIEAKIDNPALKADNAAPKIEEKESKPVLDGTAEWPADMFAGVPKFTFGKIERVSKGKEGEMMKFNIYYKDMEKGGIEKYVDLLKEAGWQADLNAAAGSGGLVGGEKDDLGLNFMFSTEDGTGMLAVFSGMKK